MGICVSDDNDKRKSQIYKSMVLQSYDYNRLGSNKIQNFFLNSHYDLVLDDYNYFFFVDNWFLSED